MSYLPATSNSQWQKDRAWDMRQAVAAGISRKPVNVFNIDKALHIIRCREEMAKDGNVDMHHSEYMEIKRLLEEFLNQK